MELQSVRALKQELSSPPVIAAMATSFAAAAGEPARLPFALGVSRDGREYRLAVRIQRVTPGLSEALQSVSERAAGEVDVRWVGPVRRQTVAVPSALPAQLSGGDSIGYLNQHTGTLGVVVVDAQGNEMILSNNHVLADENRAKPLAGIIRPGNVDGGTHPQDLVARLADFEPLVSGGANKMDAAVARIEPGVPAQRGRISGLGAVTGIRPQPAVHSTVRKVGRTTGLTVGRITAVELDEVMVEMETGILRFDDQIEIGRTGSKPFSRSGDSGSLIVDQKMRAVGLLFAGNDRVTYANPIAPVLKALAVSL